MTSSPPSPPGPPLPGRCSSCRGTWTSTNSSTTACASSTAPGSPPNGSSPPDEVVTRYGVTPAQWPAFRALTGDKSDNIPGVRGIGPKFAAALLRDGMQLSDLPGSGRLTGAKGASITTAWADALRWEAMITVRRDVNVPFAFGGGASPQLPKPADIVEKLGLW
ncbi:5'-3' exonuclease H3TH domain-containing protein [Kitasatospora sp. NPDC101176]|uniref:5'-3' exonuclease H3TH domain-containing protein n=1 Tax=Kitasatospora sp. NPDC101176 TaxID=3364099 RepID=UPI00381F993D